MATKKTVVRGTSGTGRGSKRKLKVIAIKVRVEIAELLKRDRAGTLTGKQLKTGLRRVKEQVKVIDIHLGDI